MSFIFVTYWWGRGKVCTNSQSNYSNGFKETHKPITYDKLASIWKSQMKLLNIPYYIEEIPRFSQSGKYQEGISYKPTFIKKCLNKFKKPVIYIDLDMKIHQFPSLFKNNFFDFMAFNWNIDPRITNRIDYYTMETSGGIFYFNFTKTAIKILDIWIKSMNSNRTITEIL